MLTSLRAILRGAAKSLGVERAANAAMIEEMWAEVVGVQAAAHSRIRGMRGTVVLAEAEAGPWTQDLSAQRGQYIDEINRRLGGRVVTDLRIQQVPAPFPAARPGADLPRDRAPGEPGAVEAEEEEKGLTPEDLAAVERAVAEIQDPEIREGARRAMISQMKWRRRQSPGRAAGGGA